MLTRKNIKTIRNLLGMRQQDLAHSAGVSVSLISSIECGTRNLTKEVSERICKALNLDTQTFELINKFQAGQRS